EPRRLYQVVWEETSEAGPALGKVRTPWRRPRPGLEGAAWRVRELAFVAPEGVRKSLLELGRTLLDGARSVASADRLLAIVDRTELERELVEQRITGSPSLDRAEQRLATLEELVNRRRLVEAEASAFARVENELAIRVAASRGAERDTADEVYRLRNTLAEQLTRLEAALEP